MFMLIDILPQPACSLLQELKRQQRWCNQGGEQVCSKVNMSDSVFYRAQKELQSYGHANWHAAAAGAQPVAS